MTPRRSGLCGRSPCRWVVLIAWMAVGFVVFDGVPGADSAEPAAVTAAPASSPNQEAIAWLDRFAEVQVLFHDKDIARIRKKMVESPPEKAQQWLKETAEVRRRLDSPEWQKTRKWLGEFLKVQAIYSDKELEEFRKKVMAGTPVETAKMMKEIEQQRETLASKATDAERHRQQTMEINKAFQHEQHAQRQAARRAASKAADFGTTKSTKVTGKPSYAARAASRAPLVNSLDAARMGVYRAMWPRW